MTMMMTMMMDSVKLGAMIRVTKQNRKLTKFLIA